MFDIFKSLFGVFWAFLKYPLYIVLILFSIFILSCSIFFIYSLIKGKRIQKGSHKVLKKDSFLYKLFVKLPKQIIDDFFSKNPDAFGYKGCIIFEGRQGQGKTISMVEYARRMQKEYPLSLCTTNLGYKYQNTELEDWHMLLDYTNDIYGVIVLIDETQNWFSSSDSKNFPPEMLTVITQNRKNRRIILGTAQNFYLLAKAIRSQATEVRRCTTLFGACTIVRRFEPILDSDGSVKEFKKIGWYWFVHDKELRESYDTYKVINRLNEVGFNDFTGDVNMNVYNIISSKKKIKK